MANENAPPEGAPSALERRLATIVAADVAGYSRMMGENEEATVQTLRGHREVFDAMLKQHHGRVFNTAGDAILAEFPSAVDAVRCATEIQSALHTRNEHLPPEQRMLFRMGINLGDVVVQQGDLLGDGVNVAARLQTIAEPGGICISGSVYDQIQNKLSLQFKSLGNQTLKNIGQSVRTFTITHGERGALPVAGRSGGRSMRAMSVAAIVAAVLVAGGYWIYHERETKRVEQEALAAQLTAEKQVAVEARRVAEEQSRLAAIDAAKREEALKAEAATQAQAATEARRQAKSDRAAAAVPPPAAAVVAAAAPVKAAPAAKSPFDGNYDGSLCNFPNDPSKRTCWKVPLKIEDGVATGTWTRRALGTTSHVSATVAKDGTVRMTLDGMSARSGAAMTGAMDGHLVDKSIEVAGRWANGARLDGHWTRSP
jgi:class 3 adenylate cyclase